MIKQNQEHIFTQEIHNKYLVFNTLFSRLPYDKVTKIGQLMPFLYDVARVRLEKGEAPKEIIDHFFAQYTSIHSEKDKVDTLFRFITYIERQVVLFDSVEDAAFEKLNNSNGSGTLTALMALADQQNKKEQVKEKLRNFKVRVVFTAHPTQFYPNSVLRIIQDLEDNIKKNDISAIDSLLQQLGKTPFINEEKPTPLAEAQSIIFYLRHVYYEAISQIHEKIYSQILAEEEEETFQPIIELGFWPGGDRDGNPFVTAEITLKVAQELRTNILKSYYNSFKAIRRRFTFKGIIPLLDKISNRLYTNMFGLHNDLSEGELLNGLYEVRNLLIEKHNGLFIDELDLYIRRVRLFGLHFASMDIRQDSSVHSKTMQAVIEAFGFKNEKYEDWPQEKKIEFLTQYQGQVDEDLFEDELIRDTFKTIKAIETIQQKNGKKACHRYIISNSTGPESVLEVWAMFRFSGHIPENICLDIVPLFETMEGLDAAQTTMQSLYLNNDYAAHLNRRNNDQHIMLGFSDGTKDGGYIKANWEIFRTKERLTEVSEQHHIKVVFFDGRGGPPARGGGKTHQFYASQGATIANHEIQITIQGQTITSMFGSIPQAKFNFEQLLSAGIINDHFADNTSTLDEQERLFLAELAKTGGDKYSELKSHPKFVSYLEHKSTLKYYGKTKIGSRPSKRSSSDQLKISDLRAIPFVGSWSQLKQNVPGFYGLGWALQQKIDQGKLSQLQQFYTDSLYFKTLIQNSMMSLSKCYFPLTYYMKSDPEYGEFWSLLFEEYERSVKNMLAVAQQNELMETEQLSKMSVKYREDIVLPLLAIQQYALQMIELTSDPELRTVYEKMVTRSLFGNINASRNSA